MPRLTVRFRGVADDSASEVSSVVAGRGRAGSGAGGSRQGEGADVDSSGSESGVGAGSSSNTDSMLQEACQVVDEMRAKMYFV